MKNLYHLQVAKVIDDYSVVLNAGSEDIVREGMTFVIYTPGHEIIDPDSGKSLGKLELVKGNVKVIHVQEKMCIASAVSGSLRNDMTVTGLALSLGLNLQNSLPRKRQDVVVGDLARRTS